MEKETQNENTLKELIKEWETDRLILKPTNLDDVDKLASLLCDKNITRYISSDPFDIQSIEIANELIISTIFNYDIVLTIHIKDNNEIIGQVGYIETRTGMISLSFWIGQKFQNKGYATEAVLKLSNHVFKNSTANTLMIEFHTDNIGSFKLSTKIKDYILQENSTYETYTDERKTEITVKEINDNNIKLESNYEGTRGPKKSKFFGSSYETVSKKTFPVELLEIGSKIEYHLQNIYILKK